MHQEFTIPTVIAAQQLGVSPEEIRRLKRKLSLTEGTHWQVRADSDCARLYWSEAGIQALATHLGIVTAQLTSTPDRNALTGLIEALGKIILPGTALFFGLLTLPFWLHGQEASHD